jgi:hypothetical protein
MLGRRPPANTSELFTPVSRMAIDPSDCTLSPAPRLFPCFKNDDRPCRVDSEPCTSTEQYIKAGAMQHLKASVDPMCLTIQHIYSGYDQLRLVLPRFLLTLRGEGRGFTLRGQGLS